MDKIVNNEDILNALHDEANAKIMQKAALRYRRKLDRDTILSCKMVAVFKSLQSHDEKLSAFTSTLYRYMCWELSKASRKCIQFCDISGNYQDARKESKIFEYTAFLPESQRLIMERRFVGNCTFKEIAEELGISQTKAFLLYEQTLEFLRKEIL